MATHDYVIANGTGAAVRADLNNALAAIVSNNSGTSEPATTYAYQWWADTTNNVLKIRNSANNAWITLRELDGTLLMEDGSNSAPGLSFASDTNTGFFSGGADKIGFATGGVERLEIGSSEVVFNDPSNDVDFRVESNGQTHMLFVDAGNDRVGIGQSAPRGHLHVHSSGATRFDLTNTATGTGGSDGVTFSIDSGTGGLNINQRESQPIKFYTADTERARLDSSGRLLVGTSSARTINTTSSWRGVQIAGTTGFESLIIERYEGSSGPAMLLGKSRGTSVGDYTIVQDNDGLGSLIFFGADGSDMNSQGARIDAFVDGTPGSNDMPGRLVFSTTADGAATPTERLRIDSEGRVHAGGTGARQLGIICSQSSDGTIPSNDGNQRHALSLGSTQTAGLNVGPTIYFYGKTNNSTADYGFAGIQGCKGSTGTNDYTGHLRFFTQNNGGANDLSETCRMTRDGLTFFGDTAAANALSDYEEGTFTPTAGSPAISGTSPTYTGFYTKIGNQVCVKVAVSSSSGNLNVSSYAVINGMPFTSAASGGFSTGVVATEDVDVFDRQGFVVGETNSTSIFISNCGSSSGTVTLTMTLVYTAA